MQSSVNWRITICFKSKEAYKQRLAAKISLLHAFKQSQSYLAMLVTYVISDRQATRTSLENAHDKKDEKYE